MRQSPLLHIVVESRGKWWFDVEGASHGAFAGQREAIVAAIVHSEVFGESDREKVVMAEGSDGRYRAVWSSAVDPYPPTDVVLDRLSDSRRPGNYSRIEAIDREAS